MLNNNNNKKCVNFSQYSYSMFAHCMHFISNFQGTIDFFFILFLVA